MNLLRKLLQAINPFKVDCSVYIATKMTGRDRHEMVERAKFACAVLEKYGLHPISPIIEEHVNDSPGELRNNSTGRLKKFWARDKFIIRRIAHAVLVDGAQEKSWGVEREYALSRYCLWKPTVLVSSIRHITVSQFEDDAMFVSLHDAAAYIHRNFGTRWQRWGWRLRMLNRSFPRWIGDQIAAFR